MQRQTGREGRRVTCEELKKDQCKKEPREQKAVEVGEASWSLWTMLSYEMRNSIIPISLSERIVTKKNVITCPWP